MQSPINTSQQDRRAPTPSAPERLLRLDEVRALCGKSSSSIYEAVKEGTFPSPVKLQGRTSAWVSSEIQQWIQTCIAESRSEKRAHYGRQTT